VLISDASLPLRCHTDRFRPGEFGGGKVGASARFNALLTAEVNVLFTYRDFMDA
jgi:hypothetical protein